MRLSKDGWTGLVVLAASLFLFWLTLGLRQNPLVPIGPGFYPRIVLGITALFAAALLVGDLLRGRKPARTERFNYGAVVLQFGLFTLYVLAMPWLGFRLATLLYVGAANATMAPPRRPVHWVRVLVVGIATALGSYVVFEQYLSVLLPRGRWTGF